MEGLGNDDTKPSSDALSTTVRGPQGGSSAEKIQRDLIRARLFPQTAKRPELGRFELGGVLGRGGMGVVYKAHDPRLDRWVAIKLLADGVGDADLHERLIREARALARLSHPHVVQVYEAGEQDGRVFLAIEYVEGGTLLDAWEALDDGDWRAKLRLLVAAGRGLMAAHERDIVHRDFKPANVLVTSDGVAKVTDFGIARASWGTREATKPADEGAGSVLAPSALGLTSTGTVMGTPAYMSPEQICGDPVDAASDQFSFCIVAFEALTGRRPFPGRSVSELRVALLQPGPIEWPEGGGLPRRVRAAIERGLARDPAGRWPSLGALLDELDASLEPRGTRWATIGLASSLLLAGAMWSFGGATTPDCGLASSARELVDDGARQALRRGYAQTGVDYAEAAAGGTLAGLDALALRIDEAQADSCRATYERGEQSAERLDARSRCFERHRRSVSELLSELSAPSLRAIAGADAQIERLTESAACLDALALPVGATGEAMARVETQLDRASIQTGLGDWSAAEASLVEATAQAERLADRRSLARASRLRGELAAASDAQREARTHFEAAIDLAEASGNDAEALDAWRGLTRVAHQGLEDPALAKAAARRVESLADRLGRSDAVRRDLQLASMAIAELEQDWPRAEAEARELLAQVEGRAGGRRSQGAAEYRLAGVLYRAGHFEDALRYFDAARQSYTESLGPTHPLTLVARRASLAPRIELGRVEGLREEISELRAAFERDPDHGPREAVRLSIFEAGVAQAEGDLDAMAEAAQQGMAAFDRAPGFDPTMASQLWTARGTARFFRGDAAGAVADYREALRLLELGEAPVEDRLTARANLGEALTEAGQPTEALAHFELVRQGRAALTSVPPVERGVLARAHASALVAVGRVQEARAHYTEALAAFGEAEGQADEVKATRELLEALPASGSKPG